MVLAARRHERVAEAAAELAESGVHATAVAPDVTSAASVRACFNEVSSALSVPTVVINYQ